MIETIGRLVAGIYCCLTILAVLVSWRNEKIKGYSNVLMVVGALMIAVGVVIPHVWIFVLGLISVQIAAFLNGLAMKGKITISHHVLRSLFSLVLILMVMFG